MWTRRTWRRSKRVGQMSFYKIGSKKFDEIVMGGSPHIVHQQIPRYGHKDVNGLTFQQLLSVLNLPTFQISHSIICTQGAAI